MDSKVNNIFISFTILLLFSLLCKSSNASIHTYNKEPFREIGNSFLLFGGSEGLVASDHSSPVSSDDRLSFIRFENVTFSRTTGKSTGLIHVLIFEAADRNSIGGSAYGGQRSICCTPDLAKLKGCKQGEIIRIPSATDIKWPIVLDVRFNKRELSTNMHVTDVYVTKTGMYNLFFITCDPKLNGLKMSGKTIWKNPDGYLPGRMAPLMKFYVFMLLAYLLLSVIWLSQYVRLWKDILQLQHWILAVIVLGLFEMGFWYLDFANFNSTGMRPVALTTWVVTIGAARNTVFRLLILSVSLGYGVVRPTLGGLTFKVLLLGITYFIASELLDITEYVGAVNDVPGRERLFLVLPVAFLDAFLIIWIFTSLSTTLEQLQVKRSSVKLDIYRKFSNALAVAVVASVGWIIYELYFKATDPFNERWQSAWIITGFWHVLSFLLLVVICYLWAPSQSSQRYAYSEEIGEDFVDEEAQSLTGNVSLVKLAKEETDAGNVSNDDDEGEEEQDKRR